MRVLTLNIWNRSGPWERRVELIRRGIAELAPDVIGLQEVLRLGEEDQALEIARGLEIPYHRAYGASLELGGGLQFGNAVLSRWPIAQTRVQPLPGDPAEARCVLYALLDAPFARVPFFVTHYSWKLHDAATRLAQARVTTDFIAELAPVSAVHAGLYPPILVGDLNADPDEDTIRWLTGRAVIDGKSLFFADAWRWSGADLTDPGWTFSRKNPYACEVPEPNRRIDYILVRGPDKRSRGNITSARVVLDHPTHDTYPSDHFGVLAELGDGPA